MDDGDVILARCQVPFSISAEERPFTIRIDKNRIHALKRMLYLLSKQSSA
jgi:hypothetical protein